MQAMLSEGFTYLSVDDAYLMCRSNLLKQTLHLVTFVSFYINITT